MAAVPAQAGPLTFADVVHVLANPQTGVQNPQLRLRTVQQQGSTPTSGTATTGQQTNSGSAQGTTGGNAATTTTTTTTTTTDNGSAPSTLLQGTQTPTQQTPKVEVVNQGDIEGTVCDCGEVRVPVRFPWWWLVAGVPAVCLTGVCTHETKRCIPGPGEDENCQPIQVCTNCTSVPEPASLLLFGSGLAALGAAARRRYRVKLAQQESVATEV